MTLDEILRAVDDRPTPANTMQAARELRALRDGLAPLRLALLASYTAEPLVPFLEVEAARRGFAAEVYVGPFNAVRQELLDPASGCHAHQPAVVFVAQQVSETCPPLADDFLSLGADRVDRLIETAVGEFAAAVRGFREHSRAAVVAHNFVIPSEPALGLYEPMVASSQTSAIRRLNERLAEVARGLTAVYVLDADRLAAQVGYRVWRDDKLWHLGRAPLSAQALLALARAQAAFLQAIAGSPRKCLVLDLDNTLWGGVLGEDGLAGIQLGQSYPGRVYREFQQAILNLYRRGVVLAINSKNDADEVDEVFREHPEMILRREYFAAVRINWDDKASNMRSLAVELNLGLDSFVFFDDSPAERALMRQQVPEVLTLEVPADPLRYRATLLESGAFERLSFTEEDRRRGDMYRAQTARRELEQSATSLGDFLRGLETRVSIRAVDNYGFPRAVELIRKTNQFNLTTRRHSPGDLSVMLADPDCGVFAVQAADRFGDNGIVGVAILRQAEDSAHIDTFLLSCRVIGRGVETACLAFMAEWARGRGLTALDGEFIPTPKNAPAADFFPRHGFAPAGAEDGVGRWRLDLTSAAVAWPEFIRRDV